jgi:primosomal protein N' (replication factor Y)
MKQDYISFYEKEMTYRRLLRYPPVEKLLTVQFQSMDEDTLSQVTEYVAEHLRGEAPDVSIIGPVQASVYRVKDVYRKIIYVKHDSHDIIIQLRERMSALSREIDPRGLVLLNFDIQ